MSRHPSYSCVRCVVLLASVISVDRRLWTNIGETQPQPPVTGAAHLTPEAVSSQMMRLFGEDQIVLGRVTSSAKFRRAGEAKCRIKQIRVPRPPNPGI